MFCHISVIKDDCCVVDYGCFFLPEHIQCEWGGKPKVNAECPALFTADAATILVWHFPHFVFSLNKLIHSDAQFYRTNAADDYLSLIYKRAKVRACKCSLNA